ncbi:penicillin-binding protein 2 [Microcoleus sp. FACHB-68]|uniref:penicillin-binding protein 2 n=1 Tax=Microcoleus sp. FACHB-68 TaxID=2692826 RepID=UPI0016839270|nr:penicillin-binding protein 2 [Microcoleus sp. FACHB-68]MBD1936149.1 penicillin-binding protein 2 [Microcoleus sp. FACHB-68]
MTVFPSFSIGRRASSARTLGKPFQSILIMFGITSVMLGAIGSRLAQLQLIQGNRNRQLAENNRIRLLPKQPVRGNIFDRKGKILASSRLTHAVYLWPLDLEKTDWPRTRNRLSKILNTPESELQKRLQKSKSYKSNEPIRVARSVTPAQITALQEYSSELKGVKVDIEAVRNYPNGILAAHALGYTGEISDSDLYDLQEQGYRLGDVIGQMGIEQAFEKQLRGEWGGQQVEVDSMGQILRVLGDKPAKAGQDLHLTLDLDVQKAAEAALGNNQGAIVALNPNTGEVLAMVSRPAFDPNIFSTRISEKTWQELQSADHPFVNRALRGFPPASTFKIVTTTAGLESGEFSPDTYLGTYGSLTFGGIEFGEWNHAGFGVLGFVGALAWSSDTFFYQIGSGVGHEKLIQWTRNYGFGEKTGIELAEEEAPGLVPDEDWKVQEIEEGWYLGDTINMSIGQGFLLSTPLQVGVMFSVPANGGYKVKPHLLKDNQPAQKWRESLNLKPSTVEILQQGLREVVAGGTGAALNVPTIPPAAGKSGTAEDPPRLSHAWFGGYGPTDKPEIVVVAFGENSGGGGGSFAAPMVLQVLETYFKANKPAKPKPVQPAAE